jgi:hypothetical protein
MSLCIPVYVHTLFSCCLHSDKCLACMISMCFLEGSLSKHLSSAARFSFSLCSLSLRGLCFPALCLLSFLLSCWCVLSLSYSLPLCGKCVLFLSFTLCLAHAIASSLSLSYSMPLLQVLSLALSLTLCLSLASAFSLSLFLSS